MLKGGFGLLNECIDADGESVAETFACSRADAVVVRGGGGETLFGVDG